MKSTIPLFLTAILLTGCVESPANDQNELEQEFNNSGRAKAIEKEEDLWQYFEDLETGFSVKYPHNVTLGNNAENNELTLHIESAHIDMLDSTMGFNTETAKVNSKALSNGTYGTNVDWPLEESKKIRQVSSTNAQDFMVLGRFEVCDVKFQRFLYFFKNDHQVVISLLGQKDNILEESPEFFTVDSNNCGDEIIWEIEKQGDFYKQLENNQRPEKSQEWFDTFDAIVNTIEFFEGTANDPLYNISNLLGGTWISTEDPKYSVIFKNGTKTDLYEDEQTSFGTFELAGTDEPHLVVQEGEETYEYAIINVSKESLTLMYLPRGNFLEFTRAPTNNS
jgi:hypothetical protein